jgi:hypothetical protein
MSLIAVETRVMLQHWWDPEYRGSIAVKRRNMRVSLKQYLHKVPVMEGVPGNLAEYVPTVARLAEAYRRLVHAQEVHRADDGQATAWAVWACGPLFAEIWNTACSFQIGAQAGPASALACAESGAVEEAQRIARICEFTSELPQHDVEDWLAQETIATANLLSEAYVKASAEFKAGCQMPRQDPLVLRHHAWLQAEIVSDMLTILMEGGRPGGFRLPDGHAHRIAAMGQERSRVRPEACADSGHRVNL